MPWELDSKREVEISFARMSLPVLVLGLSTLAALGSAPLSAAHAAWGGYTYPSKSPQFRPWSRAEQGSAARWRPQQVRYVRRAIDTEGARRPYTASPAIRMHSPVFTGGRWTARKAVPVTRGQDLGVRFRPEGRPPAYGQRDAQYGDGNADPHQLKLQSQFRPTRAGRKATYEEMQYARSSPQRTYSPGMPYPLVPAQPMYGYAGNRASW